MAKKKRPVEINRSKYNQIRKMDHYSMEECIAGYCCRHGRHLGPIRSLCSFLCDCLHILILLYFLRINRSKYNQIRKMDHYSMEECIAGYYDQGYAAGFEAGRQIPLISP